MYPKLPKWVHEHLIMYPKTLNRVHEKPIMYPKTPNRVHEKPIMYPKSPKRVHENLIMYPKSPKRVHEKPIMYPKSPKWVHDKPAPKPNDTMERLKISTSVGLFRVPTDDIAYIEASGNYCDVHLFNGESVTMTFQLHYFAEVLGMLQQNFFLRVGKSLIVNKNFVYAINVTNQELKLMDYRAHRSFRLKASKEALKELKSVLELEHK